jgi:3-keto-disaccharide hydrolase
MRVLLPVFILLAIAELCQFSVLRAAEPDQGGPWITMFDGKTLDGWKASEEPGSFEVKDGTIVANVTGKKRSHLFYMAEKEPFKNFEFEAEVKTMPGSNSGIYFHTQFQENGWPSKGFESQVNNSFPPDPRRTGSLYGIVDVTHPPVKDDEWFKYSIKVEGKHVVIKLDDKTVVDYTEPENSKGSQDRNHKIGEGTFALQSHPDSTQVFYRNLRVRRLP